MRAGQRTGCGRGKRLPYIAPKRARDNVRTYHSLTHVECIAAQKQLVSVKTQNKSVSNS
jgi:hypothetical protein